MKRVLNFSKYKIVLVLLFLLILYTFMCAFSYTNAVSKDLKQNVFRLHVVANSNSDEDQNLKYIVRDNILEYINKNSKALSSKDDVIFFIKENSSKIQKIAEKTVKENGYNYPVKLEIGSFNFPTKTYGDISLPAGIYDALEIKIGKSEGKNWWCVMFPPLCFVDATNSTVPENSKNIFKENLSEEEYQLISQNSTDMNLKFKIVEMFQNINLNLAQI